jgi:hypothetical protein
MGMLRIEIFCVGGGPTTPRCWRSIR